MVYKVLVVDDDKDTLDVMGIMLKRFGMEARMANNGIDGLASLIECPPDLVLLDLQMSPMDGWEFMRAIRQRAETAEIPIMLFTAKPLTEGERRMFEGNVVRVLQKPIPPSELKRALKEFLERRNI